MTGVYSAKSLAKMNIRIKKIIAGNSGQTLVEFAFVSILFLGLIFAVVEFGRLWYYSTHLGNSVRAAARYGAVLPDPTTVVSNTQSYAMAEINAYLPSGGSNALASVVTTLFDRSGNKITGVPVHGNKITVTATYKFEFLTSSLLSDNFQMPTSLTITREASANYE